MILLCIVSVEAVWINQVYYDPTGSETYGEALELYNPDNESVNIGGWKLWTTSSEKDVEIPENTFIEPNGYFLIADEGWNESKDNETWRDADLEDKMTLKNTDGAVALVDKEGNIIDAVGWGNDENIADELFEGKPANKIDAGESLLRTKDTNDNSKDFVSSIPYFFMNGDILLNLLLGEEKEETSSLVLEDDDKKAEGIQITPTKGGKRRINVKTYSSGAVIFNGKTYNTTKVNGSYEAIIEIDYHLEPGKYSLKAGSETTEIEILPIRGFSVNERTVDVSIVPGSYDAKKIKLRNTGNTEIKIKAKSRKLSSSEKDLEGKIIVSGKTLTEEYLEILTLKAGETKELEVAVSADENAEKGSYSSIISFITE